jgi:hypothetical protein
VGSCDECPGLIQVDQVISPNARAGALIEQGVAVNQVKEIIEVAKVVHNWADSRELISRNRLAKYRFKRARDEPSTSPTSIPPNSGTCSSGLSIREWGLSGGRGRY